MILNSGFPIVEQQVFVIIYNYMRSNYKVPFTVFLIAADCFKILN